MTGRDLTLGRVHTQLYRKFSTETENTKQNIGTLMGASFHGKKKTSPCCVTPPPKVSVSLLGWFPFTEIPQWGIHTRKRCF